MVILNMHNLVATNHAAALLNCNSSYRLPPSLAPRAHFTMLFFRVFFYHPLLHPPPLHVPPSLAPHPVLPLATLSHPHATLVATSLSPCRIAAASNAAPACMGAIAALLLARHVYCGHILLEAVGRWSGVQAPA